MPPILPSTLLGRSAQALVLMTVACRPGDALPVVPPDAEADAPRSGPSTAQAVEAPTPSTDDPAAPEPAPTFEPLPAPDPTTLVGTVKLEEPPLRTALEPASAVEVRERWSVLSETYAWHCIDVDLDVADDATYLRMRSAVAAVTEKLGYDTKVEDSRLFAGRSVDPNPKPVADMAPWNDHVSLMKPRDEAMLSTCIVHVAGDARGPMLALMRAEPVFAHTTEVLGDERLVQLRSVDLECWKDELVLKIRGGIHGPDQVEPVARWLAARGYRAEDEGFGQHTHPSGMQTLALIGGVLDGKIDVQLELRLPGYGACGPMLATTP